MTETRPEWYFIVNPRAGSGKTMSEWVPGERRLAKLKVPFETVYTDHKRHATALAYEAAAAGYRNIAAVGGDGSLHETFAGICKYCDQTGTPTEDFHLAVAPIGSGNDWIKSLSVPHNVSDVITLISKHSFSKMDVVTVRMGGQKVSYMANIGGIGFDSHVCKRVNLQKESGMRSKMIYLDGLRHTMFNLKPINIKVIADGKTVHEGPTYTMALGNGRYSGSGMRQVPLAHMDDGILDWFIVPKIPLFKIAACIPRLFNGTVTEVACTKSGKCRSLQIIPLDDASADIVELDGEIEGRLPLSIEMDARQIHVLKG